jgi:hypothetical protein
MPLVVVFSRYPPNLADKVAKKYLEMLQKMPVPDYVRRLVPAASDVKEDGVNVINIDEIKKDKLGDAIEYASKFMLGFREIEGFSWSIETWATISEALSYIGMG